ncbi:hypothetical protein AB0M10_26830 [Streptomyces sp. NPDC051840]|uniref:hypothetical protein n=1 Tax=Streptomyces sp. NPDC051840 TaxID=3154752 RepID=UPI003443CA76
MPLHPSPLRVLGHGARLGVKEAEAALVEHYPRLVRLAYLILPPALGRHRRVLTAHAVVQRALRTGARNTANQGADAVPSQRSGGTTDGVPRTAAYTAVRLRVVRAALAHERRPRWWPGRLPAPAALRPSVPVVRGLRLFPRAGGMDELALDRALADAPATVRAALGARLLENLSTDCAAALLTEAGAGDSSAALRTAGRLAGEDHARVGRMLRSDEFDPCTVQTRPTDLLRRRNRVRAGAAALVLLAVTGALVLPAVTEAGDTRPAALPAPVAGGALDASALLRTSPEQWADTSRVDFSAWPARGGRSGDRALLERALSGWAAPPADAEITTAPGTSRVAPALPPRLLYAGDVADETVVLFHDGGVRVVRYAEPSSGKGSPTFEFARVDDADVTTASALTVSRTRTSARYLLAPWIAESATRDLLAPGTPARPLEVGTDGVTVPVPVPQDGGDCAAWPVLQLRSSERIVERHAFLVTDLGELSPVHLTHTPAPGSGAPARQPREATGPEALSGWARTACPLRTLRHAGVRAVNNWQFARQPLPGGGSTADWMCTRADTWQGQGRVLVQFLPPAASPVARAQVVSERRNTALCSRFGQHLVAGAHWRAPDGSWYVLAAGSRAVERIEITGSVRGSAERPTLALRAPRGAQFRVGAELRGGGPVPAAG